MPIRDPSQDEDAIALIKYADQEQHRGLWQPYRLPVGEKPVVLARAVRWLLVSKHSPFGWSPEGRPQTCSRFYAMRWVMPDGSWTTDPTAVLSQDGGYHHGQLKIWLKRTNTPRMH